MSRAEPAPDDLRTEADRILEGDEYQPPDDTLLERAVDWFGERVDDVLGALSGRGAGTLVTWAVLGALAALVLWLVGRLGGGVWRLPVRHGPRSEVWVVAPAVDANGWRRRAEAAEAAGDLAEAVRCHWRARVADLARSGIVEERASGTAGEYRRAAAGRDPSAASAFEHPTALFEDVWFGSAAADPETVRSVRGPR